VEAERGLNYVEKRLVFQDWPRIEKANSFVCGRRL